MRKFIIPFALLAGVVLFACEQTNNDAAADPTAMTQTKLQQRGEYLVNAMGCDDCHSPKVMGPNGPEPDMSRRFSGHPADEKLTAVDTSVLKNWALFSPTLTAAVGPWGVSYAANLTSDESGIGNWTEEQFIRAIREGKSKGLENGRPILPPMPWLMYRNLNDEDLKAIYTYFKSTKPIRNVVPAPHSIAELGS